MNNSTCEFGVPEHVHVENEWYDGPRAGVAEIQDKLSRFRSNFDESEDDYLGTYQFWPITAEELSLEVEQWSIFVHWNTEYERGLVGTETHPGHPGTNARWDEIEALLQCRRAAAPLKAKTARAEVVSIADAERYSFSGPSYMMRWRVL